MVELCRVDDRLLHGQVAVAWVGEVRPDAILIANDEAATNEIQKLALKMAKPSGVKLAIRTLKEAMEILEHPKSKKMKIFLITKTLQDALKLVKMTKEIHRINIGGVKNKEGGKMIAAAVCLDDEDLMALKELCTLVEDVEMRMVPTEKKTSIDKYLNEKEE